MINAYGRRFRIAGQRWTGSVIVFLIEPFMATVALCWRCAGLEPVVQESGVQVLLLGCGLRAEWPSKELRGWLREKGVVVEPMDTGAAARTFNVMLTEDRAVAAALLAVE